MSASSRGRGSTPACSSRRHSAVPDRTDGHPRRGAGCPSSPNYSRLSTPDWYGDERCILEIVTGTAIWYHSGLPPAPIRWVLVRDPTGGRDPQVFLCTDLDATPVEILGWFVSRWSIETTFQESAHLSVEMQRQWSDLAVARGRPRGIINANLASATPSPPFDPERAEFINVSASAQFQLPLWKDSLARFATRRGIYKVEIRPLAFHASWPFVYLFIARKLLRITVTIQCRTIR
jgi:hypothetical protein